MYDDEQKDLAKTADILRAQQEYPVPILSPAELNVLESGYINTFDDALAVLEDAQQIKPTDILGNNEK